MNLLFRLFLAFNSSSLILVIYLIKSGITIQLYPPCIFHIPNFISYLFYIFIVIVLTAYSLQLSKKLQQDTMQKKSITAIEYANDSFLPSYLGYFFVALDVPNNETLYFVYSVILVFTFLSQTIYFNPIFLIFGYQFYNLTTSNNVRIFVITRQKLKDPQLAEFPILYRINDFTFIENNE